MKYLKQLDKATAGQYAEDLLGVYKVRGSSTYVNIADNYVNRIVLGVGFENVANVYAYWLSEATKYFRWNDLNDFQQRDVLEMCVNRYYLNRNPMGSGKTIETIAALAILKLRTVLIVCPNPVAGQWVKKLQEWWPECSDSIKLMGMNDPVTSGYVHIVNPEKIVSKKAGDKYNNLLWDIVVVDEAHMLKNRDSQRTTKIKQIPTSRRYALTGTPILKHPDDLYSILHFVNPLITGNSYWGFTEYFCHVVEGYYGRQIGGLTKNKKHVEVLHKILDRVSCYNDVEVGSGKEIIPVSLIMDKKQKALYSAIKQILLDDLPDNITIPNAAVLLARLIQTTSAPSIFACDGKYKNVGVGVKFEWIENLLESCPDEKVVIYSRFSEVLYELEKYLHKNKKSCVMYTGKIPQRKRDEAKLKFIQSQPQECQAILGTIGALGTGVDGLQEVCHICVFIDRDFLPDINRQCEDRLNRDGQKRKVLVYYLECDKTADAKVAKVNLTRSEDIRKALND